MPLNKNHFGRLFIYNRLFRSGRKFRWEQLADACEQSLLVSTRPSRRTVLADIQYMRNEFNAPIPKADNGLYYYSDKSFNIFTENFDEDDLKKLMRIQKLLEQLKPLSESDELKELIFRMETRFGLKSFTTEAVVFYENNPLLKNLNLLPHIYQTITEKNMAKLVYKAFNEPQRVVVVNPLFLKEYRNRWYLIAHCDDKNCIHHFALDRIEKFEPLQQKAPKTDLSPIVSRFDNIVGVTIPENQAKVAVKLEIYNDTIPYIKTKPLHASQQIIKESKNKILIQLNLIPNYELIQLILSFGNNIKVVSPTSLKKNIHEILKKTCKYYE